MREDSFEAQKPVLRFTKGMFPGGKPQLSPSLERLSWNRFGGG